MSARSSAGRTDPLRHLAVLKLDFINWQRVEYKVNDHGVESEVKKEADHGFSDELNTKLEHYGALFVKYLRFREKVSLMPLAPDQQILQKLHGL